MLSLDTCLLQAPDLQVHQEFDTVFLIPRVARPLRLNASGSRIWQFVAGGVSVGDITRQYAAGAARTVEECAPEVITFLDRMVSSGFLVPQLAAVPRPRTAAGFQPRYEVRTPAFFAASWRQQPCHLPGLLGSDYRQRFTPTEFLKWCRKPATARVYERIEAERPGGTRALAFADAQQAPAYYEQHRDRAPMTLLLNGVERVSADIRAIRRSFGPAYAWRYDDVVSTLSPVSSGIGFHAGHEDGFLVQLQGSREWKLWWPDVLSDSYKRSLLGDDTVSTADPPRPTRPPDFVFHLEAGDALYLPVFMGHEGVTTSDSIALSVGWAGLSPARVLERMGRLADAAIRGRVRQHAADFYRLLPDPAPDAPDVAQFLQANLQPTLALLGNLAPSEDDLQTFLQSMARGDAA